MPEVPSGTFVMVKVPDGTSYEVDRAIPFGQVDSTSTSTAFTATVPGVFSLRDGVAVMLKNGVVTSASGFTININGLGAKPVYSNMAASTRETTIFNINYTLLLVYDSTRVDGGCWVNYRGYYSDANSIGYQLRTNSTAKKTAIRSRYYRIFFSSPDGVHWEPANTGYDNSATSAKTVNTRPIDPFGHIVYTSANTNYDAEAVVGATSVWQQYALNLGYSFNRTGVALTLTYPAPVYVKCTPNANGSAVIDSTTPIVQALPSTNDGKIYIYLGTAYSATNIELFASHPVYWNDGAGVKLWTGINVADKADKVTSATNGNFAALDSNGNLTDSGHKHSDYLASNTTYVSSVNGSSGAVTITGLPSVTSADNGKVLMVVNGAWAVVSLAQANGVSF